MKLRNKKTGEIGYFCFANWDSPVLIIMDKNGVQLAKYNSLAELNSEWEDYEEPKEYWFIDFNVEIKEFEVLGFEWQGWMKEIGNYFETREEAQKAVEKLKAWKRLKDKGFRFTGIAGISNNIFVSFETDSKYSGGHIMYDEYSNTDNKLNEYNEDLTLLFGGKE